MGAGVLWVPLLYAHARGYGLGVVFGVGRVICWMYIVRMENLVDSNRRICSGVVLSTSD
jgi:hypothetical protein